jgi:hypothetical protein
MSRTPVVRRLTAALVLLAILGFALPATAAPGAHHSSRATTVQTPSLLDQLLSWLGNFLGGPSPEGTEGRAKAATAAPSSILPNNGLATATSDMNIGVDPNGQH